MTSYRPKVYTASKIWHAPLWRDLRTNPSWSHVEFTARWPDMEHLEKGGAMPSPAEFAHFWTIDEQDVRRSDFVLVLAHDPYLHNGPTGDNESLRGALVEAGIGIAMGKTIITIGLAPSHSWSYHPRVVRLDDLASAKIFLRTYHVREHLSC